jgi:hypothetical protein
MHYAIDAGHKTSDAYRLQSANGTPGLTEENRILSIQKQINRSSDSMLENYEGFSKSQLKLEITLVKLTSKDFKHAQQFNPTGTLLTLPGDAVKGSPWGDDKKFA